MGHFMDFHSHIDLNILAAALTYTSKKTFVSKCTAYHLWPQEGTYTHDNGTPLKIRH